MLKSLHLENEDYSGIKKISEAGFSIKQFQFSQNKP